jgi:predicted alpha/beta superfamily hydrolase
MARAKTTGRLRRPGSLKFAYARLSRLLPYTGFLSDDRFRFHRRFASSYLSTRRDVIVYLPPDYERAEARYPVLYLQDGQNLFDPATAFGGRDWRAANTIDELIGRGLIEPIIVVGIYNTGVRRISEYTPTRDRRLRKGGKGDRYAEMLVRELKPFIDHEYRTRKSAAHTGVGGSSLGSLVSLQAGLLYPRVFGKLAILSPSVWWDERSILNVVRNYRERQRARIWLDAGTAEGSDGSKVIEDLRLLRAALVEKGWTEGVNLRYSEIESAGHDEGAWGARLGSVIEYLYTSSDPGSASVVQIPSKLTK